MKLLGFGTTFVLLTSVVLLLLVQRELAPKGGLTGRGKWLLTAGLGTGIVAFSFKLILIALFVSMPKTIVTPLLATTRGKTDQAEWYEPGINYPSCYRERKAYVWQSLPETPPILEYNPQTQHRITLGDQLFHDPRLSFNGKVSCSSCHDVRSGAGIDGRRTSVGIHGQSGRRNAPTVWNSGFQAVLFWDGRASSLEEQAKGPLTNPVEMGMPSLEMVEERIREIPEYRKKFTIAFGEDKPINIEQIASAIAAYERTLITPDTPYDRFVKGDQEALTPAQLRGMALFEEVGCVVCHTGPNFSSASNLDTFAPYRLFPAYHTPYDSRFELTKDYGLELVGNERGVWRVPSLRNVALTAPYFHNGSVDNLSDAVRIMASAQLGRPLLGEEQIDRKVTWSEKTYTLKSTVNIPLSNDEVNDIVAFLHALSSDRLVEKLARTE